MCDTEAPYNQFSLATTFAFAKTIERDSAVTGHSVRDMHYVRRFLQKYRT
jgi:hypothetical protein